MIRSFRTMEGCTTFLITFSIRLLRTRNVSLRPAVYLLQPPNTNVPKKHFMPVPPVLPSSTPDPSPEIPGPSSHQTPNIPRPHATDHRPHRAGHRPSSAGHKPQAADPLHSPDRLTHPPAHGPAHPGTLVCEERHRTNSKTRTPCHRLQKTRPRLRPDQTSPGHRPPSPDRTTYSPAHGPAIQAIRLRAEKQNQQQNKGPAPARQVP